MISWLELRTYRLVEVAVKLATPPGGVTSVLVGLAGGLGAGPRTLEGSGALQIGLTSAAVGAATPPGIWGVGGSACALPMKTPSADPTTVNPTKTEPPIRPAREVKIRLPTRSTRSHRRPLRDLEQKYHTDVQFDHAEWQYLGVQSSG